ncbi:MAG: flavin-containing monooxygenase [Nannocystaceae bacterium]
MSVQTVETLVIGAGPAGLAMGACLRVGGRSFTLVERTASVGSRWRNHYDRLHLHTVRQLSHLPYLPMPRSYGRYPSREQFVAYLENYAKTFELEPDFATEVRHASLGDDKVWQVTTSRTTYRCKNLVVATGYNAVPHRPNWPGMETYTGQLSHSGAYKNGSEYAGKRVLVVGFGNSGGEIGVDLHEHGAEVSVCVRGQVHITPRDIGAGRFQLSAQYASLLLSKLPLSVADTIAKQTQAISVGDLSQFGLSRPEYGPLRGIVERGRVPLIDVGILPLITAGKVAVVGAIDRFDEAGVWLADGSHRTFDAVVLATGYRGNLKFLEGITPLLDDRGYPRVFGREAGLSGLYFVGFRNTPTGALREMTIEAQRVAGDIVRKAG